MRQYLFFVGLFICLGCETSLDPSGSESFGLGQSKASGGPKVIYDPLALPLPEIPLPNDVATRLDPRSPTGRRLNISAQASTDYERRARRHFNELDGFGTYAPIMVSFDAPLDLNDFTARHQNTDFRDDAVFLINLSPQCERFGEEVYLDVGAGRFPVIHYGRESLRWDPMAPNGYRFDGRNPLFEFDPQGPYRNLVFAQENEDLNGDGQLSPEEDIDQDGVLDIANFLDPSVCDESTPRRCAARCEDDACFQDCLLEYDRCVADNMMTFYERETNTLILRPLWPLEQRCTYGVVLTDRLVGNDGAAIQSPFAGVHHRNQSRDLAPLSQFLGRYGLSKANIGFAWSFTTGSMTHDIETLRAGLYGQGPFSELATKYPADWTLWSANDLSQTAANPSDALNEGDCSASAMSVFWNVGIGEFGPNLCAAEADSSSFGSIFGGTYQVPNLLADTEGVATDKYPSDHDEVWSIDAHNGEISEEPTTITFWCALPKKADNCTPGNPENRAFCPPYPTSIFAHGYGGARLNIYEFVGRHTGMGGALCAIDGPGHGNNVFKESATYSAAFTLASSYFRRYGLPGFSDLFTLGRDRDLNNDGLSDSGGDMWTANLFHTRDMVRQSVLEHMQMVRILRNLNDENADFDGDGYPDLAGPTGRIGMWGVSLGGIIAGVMAGAEPSLDAVVPNAGGAGLIDIAVRSKQAGVPDAVMLPMIGPLIVGCLPTNQHQVWASDAPDELNPCMGDTSTAQAPDELRIGFIANDVANVRTVFIGTVQGVAVGDKVRVENLDNDEIRFGRINERGFFRIGIAADAMDPIDRRALFDKADDDQEPMRFANTESIGDRIRITIFEGDTESIRTQFDRFGQDVSFQGSVYEEDAPLVVLQEGYGHQRNNPRLRRFLHLAQHGVSPADPAVWGAHTYLEPLDTAYDPFGRNGGDTRVLILPTLGDIQVPTNTGVAMGRVTGIFGSWLRDESLPAEYGWRELFVPDPRFGTSVDQYLVDKFVVEGDGRLQRYKDHNPVNPNTLFDVDNWSDGTAVFTCGDTDWSASNGENACPGDKKGSGPVCDTTSPCPSENQLCVNGLCEYVFRVPTPEIPLRQNHDRGDGTFDGFRMPLIRPAGQHGLYNAQPFRFFDHDAYSVNFTVRYLHSGGRLVDDVSGCDCTASQVPTYFLNDMPDAPSSIGATMCKSSNMKVCSTRCLEAWDIRTPTRVECIPQ